MVELVQNGHLLDILARWLHYKGEAQCATVVVLFGAGSLSHLRHGGYLIRTRSDRNKLSLMAIKYYKWSTQCHRAESEARTVHEQFYV